MAPETAAAARGRILIVDDEPVVTDVLGTLLRKEGHDVLVAPDAAMGRGMFETRGPWDAVLVDVMLPDANGLDVLRWIRERDPDTAVLMITAFGTVESAVTAMKLGAFHYLTKPFKNEEVRLLVAQAVRTTRLRTENKDLKRELEQRYRYEKIVGKSRAMQEVYRFIDQVAQSRATVLINGESGTGKELVAHAIHRRSPRADEPFVIVNSHSIPTELLEDNLFGHSRGAFTGANASKIGLLEVADRGTVLFDEISTVTPEVQTKLLRVIQDKEFLPLGALENKLVDVRIIAATNEDLRQLIQVGRFREDLYYRLNVFPIAIAPLRDRTEDIPALAADCIDNSCRRLGVPILTLTRSQVASLQSYDWPGNVRELQNVIERAVITARSGTLRFELPGRRPTGGSTSKREEKILTYAHLKNIERENLVLALHQTNGRISGPGGAAELLGTNASTLRSRLKAMGIETERRTSYTQEIS